MDIQLPFPFSARLIRNEPLARFTAARLGGRADLLYIARESIDELVTLVRAAWEQGVPLRMLGGGANVLVRDGGIRGLVLINRVGDVQFHEDATLDVTSGHALTVLARKCAARGLAGFEWAVSVPGTIGGAVVNNAGAHGGDMAGNVVTVDVVDLQRGRYTLTKDEMGYGYRTSVLKAQPGATGTDGPRSLADRPLVVVAKLALAPDDPDAIHARMEEFVGHRKKTQPPGASLGSIFKNPLGDFAGRLIESCGLKGLRIGGAEVSPVHANFFINTGNATAADYEALIEQVRAAVADRTGVILEPEIEIVGEK